MKLIKAGNKIYQLKFGLKALMALEEIEYNNEQEKLKWKFYLALNDPSLTMDDAEKLLSEIGVNDIVSLLDEVMRDSLGGVIDDSSTLSIRDQVEDLYMLAVGQVGIDPHLFFDLSPHEIVLIYKGYLKDKELNTNLNMISRSRTNKFNIYSEEYQPSTMAKRIETFSSLGI